MLRSKVMLVKAGKIARVAFGASELAAGRASAPTVSVVWRDNQDERGATIKMRRSGRMVNDCRWPRVLQAD